MSLACPPKHHRLLSVTILSAAGLSVAGISLALTGSTETQALTCTFEGDICTFSSSDPSEQLAFFGDGTDGSGDNGTGGTFDFQTRVDYSRLQNGVTYAAYVESIGGDGDTRVPSAGGNGGNLVINAPPTAIYRIAEPLTSTTSGGVLHTVAAVTAGGDGPDDNSNNETNGAAGGNAGSLIFNGAVTTFYSVEGGVSVPYDLIGVSLLSRGGRGGRGNSGANFRPLGGDGGGGGAVTVTTGTVTVGSPPQSNEVAEPAIGTSIYGVRARSIGGSGPDDFNHTLDKVQGAGGSSSGGAAGSVHVHVNDKITVYGRSTGGALRGVSAESQGGDGGWSWNVGLNPGNTDGGPGGTGGDVFVTVDSSVVATQTGSRQSQNRSAAVLASSKGGNGGVGQSFQAGGSGGDGGAVSLTVSGVAQRVNASGTAVDAIFASSVGGVGDPGLENADDSDGGSGGSGGEVSVIVERHDDPDVAVISAAATSDQTVSGRGIVAQSIGSEGGAGGDGNEILGIAGDAGAGGNGRAVSVSIDTTSVATGGVVANDSSGPGASLPYAHAILAQSIGGGGGEGSEFLGIFEQNGGTGGQGGNGGPVSITTSGNGSSLSTSGLMASGILAQSISGGGGNGGTSGLAVVSLGGDGGDAGQSGAVTVNNAMDVTTLSYGAHGIVAQSIVNGGGVAGVGEGVLIGIGASGGTGGGLPGAMTIRSTGTISTSGDAAVGLLAQSIGGGGGSATGDGGENTGIVGIGGSGGDGGSGGAIEIDAFGTIRTGFSSSGGEFAYGLHVQSIGGGGGNGGDAFSGSVLLPGTGAFGGQGGGGGDGGNVTIDNGSTGGSITTDGSGATGILAQSIGGGGGAGGDARSVSILTLVQLAIGGTTAGGGDGGQINITLDDADVETKASRSMAIVAQSIGGGGGSGGSGQSRTAGLLSVGVAAGGRGSVGGAGGDVVVSMSNGSIATATEADTASAANAVGILAQSVGGGGGIAGGAEANAITTGLPNLDDPAESFSINAQFAFGASGGTAGDGRDVTVSVADGAAISTNGASSHGILAQSIGGGGGTGGDASTAAITFQDAPGQFDLAAAIAIGGTGGAGGTTGRVEVNVGSAHAAADARTTRIVTTGDYSNAVMAQAIAGGGGNGGAPSVSTDTIRGRMNVSFLLGVGASELEEGAPAGPAAAFVHGDARITTVGAGSRGVLVQSIGGGGGTAQGSEIKFAASLKTATSGSFSGGATLALGSRGGAGGIGGAADVSVASGATITTAGVDADGILVQTIGGGGGLAGTLGSAGISATVGTALSDPTVSLTSDITIGGQGGTGGAACDASSSGLTGWTGDGVCVLATHAGAIDTSGDWADGIVAQAIGGGGGVGGHASATGNRKSSQMDLALGGSGGTGGAGGAVQVTLHGGASVHTRGYSAVGVIAQSIGGGGGIGGDGTTRVTTLRNADGEKAVGLGFGIAGGGSSGNPGAGDDVAISFFDGASSIVTEGDGAHGIVLQSIGGGGGYGGAGNVATLDNATDAGVAFGGTNGGAGDARGGSVRTFFSTGSDVLGSVTIETAGAGAVGLIAQSVGGGGGIFGVGSSYNITSLAMGVPDTGGFENAGSGPVNVGLEANSSITTSGTAAHGLIAQAVGGGGGIAGLWRASYDSGSWTTTSAGGASAASVSVQVTGSDIAVTGDDAVAIVAQSVGGGGGLGATGPGAGESQRVLGSTGIAGTAGEVSVAVSQGSTVTASGADGIAILATSDGPDGAGRVDVSIDSSTVSATGTGVLFVNGNADNRLELTSGAQLLGGDDAAFRQVNNNYPASGCLTVSNDGTVQTSGGSSGGCSDTAADAANMERTVGADPSLPVPGARFAFTNDRNGRLLASGDFRQDVVNEGVIHVGREGEIAALRLDGSLHQTKRGRLVVDADFDRERHDKLSVTQRAHLDGTIEVAPRTLAPGASLRILSAREGLTGSAAIDGSPAVVYSAKRTDTALALSVRETRFAVAFATLDPNQREAGAHLDATFDAGAGALAEPLADFAAIADADDGGRAYAEGLSALSPGGSQAAAAAQAGLAQSRLDKTMSCPAFSGEDARLGEDACIWGEVGGAYVDQSGSGGYDGTIAGVAGGGQFAFNEGWFGGLAVGYENSNLDALDGLSSTDGETGFLSAGLKRQIGAITLGAGLSGSWGHYDVDRSVNAPGFAGTASGESDIATVAGRVRVAYTIANEDAYLTPLVDLDVVYTHASGYTETGAGLFNLAVEDNEQTAFVATPGVEAGARVDLSNGLTARVFASAGLSLSTEDDWTTTAALAEAPAGSGTFDTTIPSADVVGRVGLGIQLSNSQGFDLRGQYDGAFGDDYQSHSGTLRIVKRF